MDSRRAFALIVCCGSMLSATALVRAQPTEDGVSRGATSEIISLVNGLRQRQALPALQAEGRLTQTARDFAIYLASTGKLDHEADGTTPGDRVVARHYDYCVVGENLAYEYSSRGFSADGLARTLVEGWNASPPHHENIVQPDVTQTGVAVVRAPNGTYYAVQLFGRPRTDTIKFRITNRTNRTVTYTYAEKTTTLRSRQTRMHERCTSGEIRLDDSAASSNPVKVRNGDRFAIVSSNGEPATIKRE